MTTHHRQRVLISTLRLSRRTGLSLSFLYRNAKKMDGRYQVGRCFRWHEAEVREWLRVQAQQDKGVS